MLNREDYMKIEVLSERGVYQKDIAEELGVHPKTVSRALKRKGAPKRAKQKRATKLDGHKATVDRLLAEGVWNGRVILREIQAQGYTGGETMLRLYIAPKHVLRQGKATVRYETEPGEQLQSDWGELETEIGGVATKVHFLVNTLGWSRRFHFWCTASEDAEHTYEGLIRSFEYLGGVVREVLVDNQKAAVLAHSRGKGGVRFNQRFVDLAGHYGFTPKACRPYRARTKGKDERMVGYIKQHFFVRYRRFDSWVHLNQVAEQWLAEEADRRVQSTVKEVVIERFGREAAHLRPLPAQRYDTSYLELRQVSWDSYIDVRAGAHWARYSVPAAYAGRSVVVRIGLDGTLRIYAGEELLTTHALTPAQQGWVTVAEHLAPLWRATLGSALQVEQRPLAHYEQASLWS
jgi:transposase